MTLTSVLRLAPVLAILALSAPAFAGDCTGRVVDVRPLKQYNHAKGNGFLAVRTGPGGKYAQVGELYLGDEVAVWNRRGNWYEVQCMSGTCNNPLWGQPSPHGWVSGRYLAVGGLCP
jgi:uncharacterized protein YraI